MGHQSMFLISNSGAGRYVTPARVGSRLPLHADFLTKDWTWNGLLFGDDVFPEPGPSIFDHPGVDPCVFLLPVHRFVSVLGLAAFLPSPCLAVRRAASDPAVDVASFRVFEAGPTFR